MHGRAGFPVTVLGAVAACVAVGRVRAQKPAPDPIVLAIEPLLASSDAEIRGEAALAVATTGDPKYHARIQELTADPDAECRQRAILALGWLGEPGSGVILDRKLRTSRRESADRLMAALALGLLPDEPRVAALDAFFNRLQGASRNRVRNELVAVLLGLRQRDHDVRMTILRTFTTDATYRHRPELALVIQCLARVAGRENDATFLRMLGSRHAEIQVAALRALRRKGVEITRGQLRRILRLADRAAPGVRAAAIDLLAFRRSPEALEVAGRALHSEDAACVAAAVRTIVRLGGGELRTALEDHILAIADPEMRSRMLLAKRGPHGDAFVKACLDTANDATQGFGLRVAASKVVSEAGWKEIAPIARRLFLTAREAASAVELARALHRLRVPLDDKVLPLATAEAIELMPLRLRALLASGNPQAYSIVLRQIEKPAHPGLRLEALRAYRRARLHLTDETTAALVPEALRAILD